MPDPTPQSNNLASASRPKRWWNHDIPTWVVVVIVVLAGPLAVFGVFSLGSYLTSHTTVTIDSAT